MAKRLNSTATRQGVHAIAAQAAELEDSLKGAVVETELGIMIWRKIDEDLLLTATFPQSAALLEIYPSVSTLISRLGSKPSKQLNPS